MYTRKWSLGNDIYAFSFRLYLLYVCELIKRHLIEIHDLIQNLYNHLIDSRKSMFCQSLQ